MFIDERTERESAEPVLIRVGRRDTHVLDVNSPGVSNGRPVDPATDQNGSEDLEDAAVECQDPMTVRKRIDLQNLAHSAEVNPIELPTPTRKPAVAKSNTAIGPRLRLAASPVMDGPMRALPGVSCWPWASCCGALAVRLC